MFYVWQFLTFIYLNLDSGVAMHKKVSVKKCHLPGLIEKPATTFLGALYNKMRTKKNTMNYYDLNDCQQFSFITQLFSDTCKHTKSKSWWRCRLYFRDKMQCWWIFDSETDYRLNKQLFLVAFFSICFFYYTELNWLNPVSTV
jgi:hypothetical protein